MTIGSVIVDRGFMVEDPERAAANRLMIDQDNERKPRRGWNLNEPLIEVGRDFEKEKDAMLEDYRNRTLPLAKMLAKYHISTHTWQKLKEKWNVPSKSRHPRGGKRKPIKTLVKVDQKVDQPVTCAKTQTGQIERIQHYVIPRCTRDLVCNDRTYSAMIALPNWENYSVCPRMRRRLRLSEDETHA